MKKRGFTLIELLAVIVVLAILALITFPLITRVVEKARKGAAKNGAEGYIDAVEKYMAMHEVNPTQYPINLEEGKTYQVSSEETYVFLPFEKVYAEEVYLNNIVKVKGKLPQSGKVTIGEKRRVESAMLVVSNYEVKCKGETCDVKKNINEVTIADKTKRLTDGGLYDEKYNLIATWEELTTTYGLNVSNNYNDADYLVDSTSGYNVLKNANLSNGAILVIPEGVTNIGDNAFKGANIKSVKIPSSVTEIGKGAFSETNNLQAVVFEENSSVTTIKESAFEGSNVKEIEIPKSVVTIEKNAFKDATKLEDLTFEENSNLTTIKESAFENNSSLEEVEIPKNVTIIEKNAFKDNTELKTVTFESGSKLETIGESAFENNSSLTKVEVPSSVTTIEDNAFKDNTK